MANTGRYYNFKFSDGFERGMRPQDAIDYRKNRYRYKLCTLRQTKLHVHKKQWIWAWFEFIFGTPLLLISNDLEIIDNGYDRALNYDPKRARDSFKAGWQSHLGMYIGGEKAHRRELTRRGLDEIGTEEAPEQKRIEKDQFYDDTILKEYHDMGFKLSGSEIEHLKRTN